jgi:dGTPase
MVVRRSKQDYEKLETKVLASYAQHSAESRGRAHVEEPHAFRTEFQRDRAFRRLEYKSQVFLNGAGDHYRTRLTHTIEVASIARTLARALRLNEDLAETIALAHDLGHPPFGHPGEATLNKLMRDYGGFEHNQQSLRIVEELEQKYPHFNGLNLSWEALEGLAKHGSMTAHRPQNLPPGEFKMPSLEAQVADLADAIAYVSHDIDDGLESGFLQDAELSKLELVEQVEKQYLAPYPKMDPERKRGFLVRCLLDYLVEDAVSASNLWITESKIQTADDARRQPQPLVGFGVATGQQLQKLREFLKANFYNHPEIEGMNRRACRCLEELFELLVSHPHLLSAQHAVRVKKEGLHRAVCNYLSGMTDRYALQQHQKLIGGDISKSAPGFEQSALF